MKNIKYFFAAIFIVAALVSCEKEQGDETLLKKSDTEGVPVSLDSKSGSVPVIIPGTNNGGNRTCADVEAAFELPENFLFCWDKIDYSDGEFMGEFPEGLTVTVTDGRFVSFKMDNCLKFGDKFYKVGAVIVKGSNEANVYFYKGGIMEDNGLASPLNASGKPAGLSNLSFCFVECKEPLIVALKSYIVPEEGKNDYVITRGVGSEINSLHIGYFTYNFSDISVDLFLGKWGDKVGTLSMTDYFENDIHYLEVELKLTDFNYSSWKFDTSYLYVGSLEGYEDHLDLVDGMYFSQYLHFPFIENELLTVRTFKIPFDEIVD